MRLLKLLLVIVACAAAVPVVAGPFEEGRVAYDRGDYATALNLWRPLAERGEAHAQDELGVMYELGNGVPQDYAAAATWYRKAAEQGIAHPQHKLGFMYTKGQGVPRDYAAAVTWYRKAAEQGWPYSQTDLGFMYAKGQGVPQDYGLAYMWFNLSATTWSSPPWLETWGSTECAEGTDIRQRCMATAARDWVAARMTPALLAEAQKLARDWKPTQAIVSPATPTASAPPPQRSTSGSSIPMAAGPLEDAEAAYKRGDYATALRLLRPMAELGDATAQANLGRMYDEGRGVPQDAALAIDWYRKAADQGSARAQHILSSFYYIGRGVPQDYAAAALWERKAADQGFARAQYGLGVMYRNGRGVPQDYAAAAWAHKAADQDYHLAQVYLGAMYEDGIGVQRNYVQAYKWFNIAAQKENLGLGTQRRDSIAKMMTPAQIAEAQNLAREWKPTR